MSEPPVELYPPLEPYAEGLLDVGDGNQIAWEASGNPDGKPAVGLHGGPGQGSAPNMRRQFDPARYRIILFDQRGCGRSLPNASEPTTDMSCNTTAHLVADIERLREHLGIQRWLVSGGSWGTTLALAYAQQHPARVSALVLSSITTSRRSESDWLYRGLSRFFPEAWDRFSAHVPEAAGTDVVLAYARRMEHPDLAMRLAAARAWGAWEDATLGLEPNPSPSSWVDLPDGELMALVRICAHYASHGAWLDEGALVRDVGKLRGIPGALIHGRRDLTCPIDTAWQLAQGWPDAELVALDDAGHLRSNSKRVALLRVLDAFARKA